MDKKMLLTILIAALLALLTTFIIIKKSEYSSLPEVQKQVQEETILSEEKNVSGNEEPVKEEANEEDNKEADVLNKKAIQSQNVQKKTEVSKEVKVQKQLEERVVVQEGSVVEEVEKDYGVKKVGDTIEVTREFKFKSPTKYSFKDFGILDKVSTK